MRRRKDEEEEEEEEERPGHVLAWRPRSAPVCISTCQRLPSIDKTGAEEEEEEEETNIETSN